jgi:hypothetical protein
MLQQQVSSTGWRGSRRSVWIALPALVGLVFAAAESVPQAQKGTSPKVTYTGAIAAVSSGCGQSCTATITGDGSDYIGTPAFSTARGAFLIGYNYNPPTEDFGLKLDGTGGRSLSLSFDDIAGATCGSKCRMPAAWASAPVGVTHTWGPNGLRVRPMDASGPVAMSSMGLETLEAFGSINFEAYDRSGRLMVWTVRLPQGSLTVTRTGGASWVINTADPGLDATLEASPDGSSRGRTYEGSFPVCPFSIQVTVS